MSLKASLDKPRPPLNPGDGGDNFGGGGDDGDAGLVGSAKGHFAGDDATRVLEVRWCNP